MGAYTVPSAIFAGVGSVGMTLLLWALGSFISFCGLAVYLDLGTAMPRSGGERVYLERMFYRPRMMATCMFMAYAVLLGFSAPNAIVLAEYAVYTFGGSGSSSEKAASPWAVRAVAVAVVSAVCWVHARHARLGPPLINVLGVAKMLILVVVVISGVAGALIGIGRENSLSCWGASSTLPSAAAHQGAASAPPSAASATSGLGPRRSRTITRPPS